ncbi:hypothetical protein IC762_30105 [Bradyrhizobium genosp. L]|uniref:hypothetical protein n=1 Tax=Bradyrhizobium genosp. L TaxID=83637 RepID=UPI0018A24F7D|nr:hypothetical protein [Bradyrhizobium genosp. L]QPF83876.1 hypothetical protein IC762_30105 [Bradyrhizobium genosp. L]
MMIDSSGNIGIGTNTPSTTLDIVAPNNGTNYIRLTSTNTGSSVRSRLILANTSSTYAILQLNGSSYPTDPNSVMLSAPSNGAYPIAFSTAGVERMRISGNGPGGAGVVGINYVSPTNALEVSGTISATNLVVNGVSITGSGATTDRVVSGSINAVADVSSGAVRVSGTLALDNTGSEPCDAAHWYTFRANPITKQLEMCRPRCSAGPLARCRRASLLPA